MKAHAEFREFMKTADFEDIQTLTNFLVCLGYYFSEVEYTDKISKTFFIDIAADYAKAKKINPYSSSPYEYLKDNGYIECDKRVTEKETIEKHNTKF